MSAELQIAEQVPVEIETRRTGLGDAIVSAELALKLATGARTAAEAALNEA